MADDGLPHPDLGESSDRGSPSVMPPAATGDPAWDDWDVPLRTPAVPVLHLSGFDGPMDLLLDLAERQRIDFGQMSILALVEQFVAAMASFADRVPLDQRAGWLVTATRLVLLRSRLLFPISPEAALEAEREAAAAIRQIDTLAFMRAAASALQARPQLGQDVFGRPHLPPQREGDYVALMEACLAVLQGRGAQPGSEAVYRPALPHLWRVPDAINRIRRLLLECPQGGALARFLPVIAADTIDRPLKAKAAVASTLLAGLELTRDGEAEIDQEIPFGPVRLAMPPRASTAESEVAVSSL
jgi:segregation and condensation protein A